MILKVLVTERTQSLKSENSWIVEMNDATDPFEGRNPDTFLLIIVDSLPTLLYIY